MKVLLRRDIPSTVSLVIGTLFISAKESFHRGIFYLISEYISNPSNCQKNDRNFLILFSLSILFPIAGWFTDAFIGRYKIIKISMIVMWISSILFCLIPLLHYHVSAMVYFHRLVIILLCIGFGGFQVTPFRHRSTT